MATGGDSLAARFVETAKRHWSMFCMADSTGRRLTYGRALVASLLLSRTLRTRIHGERIGLLLPASVGGALANVAATMAGKVTVNLNFTAGTDAMAAAIAQCGITHVVTSRTFLEKAGIAAMPGLLYLEDLLQFGVINQMLTLAAARILPAAAISRAFLVHRNADDLTAIIFSSGSTGIPKGVMLTHRNLLANVESVRGLFRLSASDVMIGVLPLFHSFGLTGTLWLPMIVGFGVAYHPNPVDARIIGDLAARYRGTLLISTPTFCASYTRKCQPEQFATLRYAIVGAERLREPVAAAFKERFGIELLEGYGCTEMAPIVAVNSPDGPGVRPGTVGRPLPGVDAMVVNPETGTGPLVDSDGLLLVRGENRMLGYLGQPERTREALRDGWYVTGDIARIDRDGFIHITDRLARFSKIGGEMVPHMQIEDRLQRLLPLPHVCVVTAVPDENKGERLVAFYTDPDSLPQRLWQALNDTDLPRLWIPKREDIRFVDAIPTLGTGKTDLRAVRELAIAGTGARA